MSEQTDIETVNAKIRCLAQHLQRRADAGMKPRKEQKPMDIGLWSDDAAQLDLVEMFATPTNEE